jgi:cytoskeletal protein CcmA (bactofilin family)
VNIKGEITGSESLLIDGIAEGSINLPENQVTVGYNGHVTADITARDVVVLGKVFGNVTALNRLDIHAESAVTGNIVAGRLTIEEGAYFKGSVDILKNMTNLEIEAKTSRELVEHSKTFLVVQPDSGKLILQPLSMSA